MLFIGRSNLPKYSRLPHYGKKHRSSQWLVRLWWDSNFIKPNCIICTDWILTDHNHHNNLRCYYTFNLHRSIQIGTLIFMIAMIFADWILTDHNHHNNLRCYSSRMISANSNRNADLYDCYDCRWFNLNFAIIILQKCKVSGNL